MEKFKKATSIENPPDPRIEKVVLKIMNMTGGYYSRLARSCKLVSDLIKEVKNVKK